MIYQIYYDQRSSEGIAAANPVIVPFGVHAARHLSRRPGHVYDDDRRPNLAEHNTLCEWRVLYYVWKHCPAPWVGFTSWAHNQKNFKPAIESVRKEQCESILRHYNIAGFYVEPLKRLIPKFIAKEYGYTLKTQFLEYSIVEILMGRTTLDARMRPLSHFHRLKYWNFVIQEFQYLYGINLEQELDFEALGEIKALHTWSNAFIANWDYFNDYMTTFSPIVLAMLEYFGSHPKELELSFICERLIILHNYIKYANDQFRTPANNMTPRAGTIRSY